MAASFIQQISKKRWLTFFCIALFTTALNGQATLYTYQSGSWNNIDVWTTDPGGTTLTGSKIPGDGDEVIILSSRTVTLTGNIATTGLRITINAGGTLDAATFAFSSPLSMLTGQGLFRLSSASFPSATTNTFVNAGGGTVEYYNGASFNLPSGQTIYNNLVINCPGFVATEVNTLTLNGNLKVQGGTFRINNATQRKLTLVVKGDVEVNTGAFISVGTGRTNPTITDPTATGTGGSAPFLDYYTAQSHRIELYGNLTNNGTVRFTNQAYPVYNLFPVNGFATVFFMGATNATITSNGTTDFYNLVVNKGTDQTYILTVNSSAYYNFRLFGANNAGSFGTDQANPHIRKALWIRNGTLKLNGYTFLPSLTEGGGDFIIPGNGAMEINSPDAVVMSTIDNYFVTELAYGVNGGGNSNGVATGSVIHTDLALYGKLQVNEGKLYVGEYSRIVYYGSSSSAQFIINGGVIDAKQFQSVFGGGRTAYWQTEGRLVLRGRFQRTLLNTNLPNLISSIGNVSQLNTNRVNGPDPGLSGTLNIDQPENIFHMEGGAIEIFDVTGTTAGTTDAIEINSDPANVSISGGTITIDMRSGSGTNADYGLYSTAPVFNAVIKRTSGTTQTVILKRPLRVLNDLTLSNMSGTPGVVLNADNQNLEIGEDFLIQANSGYDPGSNRTIFNGEGAQAFTNLGIITNGLNRFIVDKNSGTVTVGSTITVRDSLVINSGILNDGGYTLNVAGNIFNAGTHTGSGKIVFNGSTRQYIYARDGSLFGNLELKSIYSTPPYWALTFTSDISVESFRLAGSRGVVYIADYGLIIRNMALHLGDRATNYSNTKMFMTDGSHSAKGITLAMSLTGNLNTNVDTIPLGVYHQATPAAWFSQTIINVDGNLGATTYTGNITVTPVDAPHPSTSNPENVIDFYWKTFCTGTITTIDSDFITFRYYNSNVSLPNGQSKHYHLELGTSDWIGGGNYSNPLVFNLGFMSGAFTAGKNNPFMAPEICTAVRTGYWNVASTWDNGVPNSYDYVVIGNKAYGNVTVTILDNRSCAGVSIFANGVAGDLPKPTLVINANLTGVNLTTVSGGGRLVLKGTNSIVLPGGDFDMFCKNDTAIFEYTDPGPGTYSYTIPAGIQLYPNLHITSRGNNAVRTLPDNNIIVSKNLRLYSAFSANMLRFASANPRSLTINGNLEMRDGAIFELSGSGIKTINLYGNLNFQYGGTNNNNILRAAASSATHIFNFFGNSVLSGASSINFYPGGTPGCNLFIKGPGSVLVTEGTGSFNLNRLFIQKDVVSDTVRFRNNFTLNETDNAHSSKSLVLTTGTLIISDPENSSPSTVNLNLSSGGTNFFNLNSATRLILRNGAKVNISGSTSGSGIRLDGSLQAEGTSQINLADGSAGNTGYIEYSGSGNSEIRLSGSAILKSAQIRRSLSLTTGVLRYSQSGSSITTVFGIGAAGIIDASRAKFEITGTGSSFDMSSNSKLHILRGAGTTYGDLYLRPELSSVTGGEIIFGAGMSGQSFKIDATVPLQDLIIDAVAGEANVVQLMVNPLVLNGNLTLIPVNTVFNSNNINLSIGGNFLLNGTYTAGSNTTFINGVEQTISGASDPLFNNLTVSSSNKLTLMRDVTINSGLTLSSGILEAGEYNVTVKGDVLNNGIHTNDPASAGRLFLNGTSTQNISGTGSYGRMEIDNVTGGARLGNDLSLTEDLKLSNGVLNINQYSLILGQESDISPVVFGISRMIKSDGVFSNGGITKYFKAGYTGTFVYPSGVTGKYTPASLYISATDAGWVKINVINEKHPATLTPYNVLGYYWEAESSISGFEGSLTLTYNSPDVSGDESQYVAGRLIIPPGTGWSKAATGPMTDNVDEALNNIFFGFPAGTNILGGHYTAGYSSDLPNTVPVYTSNSLNGDWYEPGHWTPEAPAGGPDGAIVVIKAGDVMNTSGNKRFAFRTTINGTLKVGTSYGHNLGSVEGTGTLSMSQANLPAGDFKSFLGCSGGTLEYDGDSYTIIADRIDTVNNIIFKGTGTKGLPDKDLVICNLLEINGPVLNNQFNRRLSIAGSFVLTSGSFLSGSGADATVTFMGTNPQTVSGFQATNPLNNLEINNNSGLTLNSELMMKGNLILTSGYINTTSSNLLKMTSTAATASAGSVSSYINGPLSKNLLGGVDFTFPVGKAARFGRLTLLNPQSGVWEAEYYNTGFTDLTVAGTLVSVSMAEHWRIKSPADGKTAKIRLRWDSQSDITPVTTSGGINDIKVAEYDGSDWREKTSAVPSGNDSDGTVQTASNIPVSNTGDPHLFTLGSVSMVKPTISLGIGEPVCRCITTAYLPYIATTGNPTEYTINFSDPLIPDVTVWTSFSATPITLNLPSSLAPGVYSATIRVRTLPANESIPYSFSVLILPDISWTGNSGTSWSNSLNWSCSYLPDLNIPVIIPEVPNKPVIASGQTGIASNLTIDAGSSLTIDGTLRLSGSITNNGTITAAGGKIELAGTVSQVIPSNTFSGNRIKDLTINNIAGAVLQGPLGVTGTILLQNGDLSSAGNLTLISDATSTAIVDGSGNGNITGNVTMQRYLASRYGYKYFSSPFKNASVNEFADEVNLGNWFPLIWAFDENRKWSETPIDPFYKYVDPAYTLNPMEGYAINFGAETSELTIDMTGELNNGFVTKTLSNNNHPYSLGRHLVGNPYPSPINWDLTDGWTKSNIDDALYYFKSGGADEWEGTYSSYVNKISSDGVATNIIPSMQGFMVHVSNGAFPVEGTLSMDNRVRVLNFSQPFIKKSGKQNTLQKSLIRISAGIANYSPAEDPLVIYFDDKATNNFDNQLDALKYYNTDVTVPSIFSFGSDGSKLSIDAIPVPEDGKTVIPLGFRADIDGEVVFRLMGKEGPFSLSNLYFFDSKKGITKDLSGEEYRVFLEAGEYFDRFFLSFEGLVTGDQWSTPVPDKNFRVFSRAGLLHAEVNCLSGNRGTIMVTNLTGQTMFVKNIYSNGYYDFDPGVMEGIYIVTLKTGKLYFSEKILIVR